MARAGNCVESVDAMIQKAHAITPIPESVILARGLDWGVFVDGYIESAARVGDRYTGHVYFDGSGAPTDGMVVVTPPVDVVRSEGGFTLLRSRSAEDYYVLCSLMEN
jgi:hypothetical protein